MYPSVKIILPDQIRVFKQRGIRPKHPYFSLFVRYTVMGTAVSEWIWGKPLLLIAISLVLDNKCSTVTHILQQTEAVFPESFPYDVCIWSNYYYIKNI